MNFAEIKAEVISLTRRPDLDTQTDSAIKNATLKAHTSDFFYKDIREIAVQFGTYQFVQNFLPTDVLPRFRKAKYIRRWSGDADTGQPLNFFEPIQIENSLDSYGIIKAEVFYMAGNLLQIRGSSTVDRVLFGAYQYPQITSAGYDSWIANEAPWAIIYGATRIIMNSIGLQEQASQIEGLMLEEYNTLRIFNVDDTPLT